MKLVALNGLIGSGKSSVASILVASYGFTLVKFAGPLKRMMSQLLYDAGANSKEIERMIEGDLKEVPSGFLQGKTPRWAMQSLGTEWGRNCIGPQLWVHTVMSRMQSELAAGHSVVVDDCRFKNEAEIIHQLGGEIWRIRRPDLVACAHPSEFDQLSVGPDHVLENIGTLADLNYLVHGMMQGTISDARNDIRVLA